MKEVGDLTYLIYPELEELMSVEELLLICVESLDIICDLEAAPIIPSTAFPFLNIAIVGMLCIPNVHLLSLDSHLR